MDKSEHEEYLCDVKISPTKNDEDSWKPLVRQIWICTGLWSAYFMQGLVLGSPTVIIATMRRETNSSDTVSTEMSSWLSSFTVITSLPLILIVPWFFYHTGRKFSYIIVCINAFIAFIIFCHSTTAYHLLISQFFSSIITAAVNTFTPIIIAEYTSPKYRGIFLTIKSASTFWGIWVANATGTFFHWKKIGIIGLITSIYSLTAIAWPESPHWLAMKGRYAESAKAHRWLKGTSTASEYDLVRLINSKKNLKINSQRHDEDSFGYSTRLSNAWATITSRKFYKPALLCIIILVQYHFTGKFVCAVYAIEVLKTITKSESMAYKGMLILDGVTVFGMYLGCILSRYFKRRTLLLLFTCTGISFLYIMSLYLFLVSLSVIKESHLATILLLTAYSIAIGCGPMIFASSIYGELIPSRFQSAIMIIAGLICTSTMSLTLKLSPFMFQTLKMHGTFLFYAICSTIILFILYVYLPETKDKSVEEIEANFVGTENTKELAMNLLNSKDVKK